MITDRAQTSPQDEGADVEARIKTLERELKHLQTTLSRTGLTPKEVLSTYHKHPKYNEWLKLARPDEYHKRLSDSEKSPAHCSTTGVAVAAEVRDRSLSDYSASGPRFMRETPICRDTHTAPADVERFKQNL